jgi:hypothetical protein
VGAYPDWGWATRTAQALDLLKRFGSVTVLSGHIHQTLQRWKKCHVLFRDVTAFPQPAPGSAPAAGPMKVPRNSFAKYSGSAMSASWPVHRLAVIDRPESA